VGVVARKGGLYPDASPASWLDKLSVARLVLFRYACTKQSTTSLPHMAGVNFYKPSGIFTNMNKKPIVSFIQLMCAAFILFVLSVGMGKETAELIILTNDRSVEKSTIEWLMFSITALIATGFWCFIWVCFKSSEKECIEHLKNRSPS
jgi:uncharacterized membrane protein